MRNPANEEEGRNERRCRWRERERIREFPRRMRAQWHRAPGSSVRSSPAARPRRFSRPFRESRGTLADRGSLLVPLRFFADRAAKCRALRRKSSQREFPPSPRFDPDVCRRACVISPVDLMVRERYWSWSSRSIFREGDFFFSFLFIGARRDLFWKSRSGFGIVFFFFLFFVEKTISSEYKQEYGIVSFILSVEEFWIWKNRGEWMMVWLWWLGVFEGDFCFFFFCFFFKIIWYV